MSNNSFDPTHKNMGQHIKSGILNSGAVQIIKVFCQFASVVVLSRLLPPADFGMIAMVSPIYGFVLLFQDMGFSAATIQKPTIDHGEINAFFWINVVVGTFLAALIVAISPLIGWYYHEPRIVPLAMAMGLLVMLGSIGNQPCAILTRRLQFGVLSLTGVIGAISGLVTSILCAIWLQNYWALYIGMLVGTVLPVIGVWFAVKWKPTLPRRVKGMRAMLSFGAGITSANVLGYIARNADNVLIGHRWGDHILGLYDRAYKLLLFPLERLSTPVLYMMAPVLARILNEPQRYRTIFLKTISQLTLVLWPGIIWAIMFDDTLVPLLLGRQWTEAANIFDALAIAGLLQVINSGSVCLFMSQGRSGDIARWGLVNTVTCIIAFLIGLPYGAFGVAVAYAINETLLTPLLWAYVGRRGPVHGMDLLKIIWPQLLSGTVCACILYILDQTEIFSSYVMLAAGLILSYAFFAGIMTLTTTGRETLRNALHNMRQILEHHNPLDEDVPPAAKEHQA